MQYKECVDKLPFSLLESNKIGEGGNSIVYKSNCVINNKVKLCAIKKTGLYNKKSLYDEANILCKLDHSSVPKVYGLYCQGNTYYLVMEYIFGVDLYNIFYGNVSIIEYNKFDIILQITNVIKYLHDNNIVHLDIKLENILLEQHTGRIVIIDFGSGRKLEYIGNQEVRTNIFAGSEGFVAPEVISGKTYCGRPADIYSLGILFSDIFWFDITKNSWSSDPNIIICEYINSNYREIGFMLEYMLCENPDDRHDINVVNKIIKSIVNNILDELY